MITKNEVPTREAGLPRQIETLTTTIGEKFTKYVVLAFAMIAAPLAATATELYITRQGVRAISIVDATTGTELATRTLGGVPFSVAITPDGSKAYVTNIAANTISVIQTSSRTVTATINTPSLTWGIAVAPDGARAYAASYAASGSPGAVLVINTATDSIVGNIPVTGAYGVTVTPDGRQLYATGQTADRRASIVSVIDTSSNTVTATVPVGDSAAMLAANKTAVYVTHIGSGVVSVIDRGSLSVSATIAVSGVNTYGFIAMTPDGSLAFVPGSNSVSVIDTVSDTVAGTVPISNSTGGVAVAPDGSGAYVFKGGHPFRQQGNSIAVVDMNVVRTTVAIPFSDAYASISVKP